MKYGIYIPNGGDFADPCDVAELGRLAETCCWDGFFIWDHLLIDSAGDVPVADVWTELAAVASVTDSISIGPMIVPLARRRNQVIARQAVSLDRLSNGRLMMGVGLGVEGDFVSFGESGDAGRRGKLLDEGLEQLHGWWDGAEVCAGGPEPVRFRPLPVRRAGIPIWVGGRIPETSDAPFKRGLRESGFFPVAAEYAPHRPLSSEDYAALAERVRQSKERGGPPRGHFDLVLAARQGDVLDSPSDYEASGVTWWLESFDQSPGELDAARDAIRRGPPGRRSSQADLGNRST